MQTIFTSAIPHEITLLLVPFECTISSINSCHGEFIKIRKQIICFSSYIVSESFCSNCQMSLIYHFLPCTSTYSISNLMCSHFAMMQSKKAIWNVGWLIKMIPNFFSYMQKCMSLNLFTTIFVGTKRTRRNFFHKHWKIFEFFPLLQSAQTADSKVIYFQSNLTFSSQLFWHLKLI